MRLVLVAKADFRKTEQTNFEEIMAKEKLDLGPKDVVMLVSGNGQQLVFVSRVTEIETPANGKPAKTLKILSSRRLRLSGGRWNPLMIVNYAEKVGMELVGLKRFEDFYKDLQA